MNEMNIKILIFKWQINDKFDFIKKVFADLRTSLYIWLKDK